MFWKSSRSPIDDRARLAVLVAVAATLVIAIPLRLRASEDCPTLGEAVAEAASDVSSASDVLDQNHEVGTVVYRDSDGCYQNTGLIVGPDDGTTGDRAYDLVDQAGHLGTPSAFVHSHPYADPEDYDPGVSGLDGDKGFAEETGIPVIAVDTGPDIPNCVHGYDPETNRESTRCNF
jgi:hypothetical protein